MDVFHRDKNEYYKLSMYFFVLKKERSVFWTSYTYRLSIRLGLYAIVDVFGDVLIS